MQYKILFVDDETANLRLLERLFRDSYEVHTAVSGEAALKLLETHDVALIISDQRMPSMTGSEFLKLAAQMRPNTVRIMLTGYTDANDLVDAINSGVVYKYVTKPWVNEELQQTVRRALQHYESAKAQRQLQLQCERLQARLAATRDGFVEVILQMLDAKVPGSREHAARTTALSLAMAERLEMDWEERDVMGLAARLHDVALYCSPEGSNLARPPRTKDEAQTASANHEKGVQMLEKVPALADVAGLLRFHYEHYDGTGQPVGFAGEQIPLGARIIAVAEAYDKLRHPSGLDAVEIPHDDAIRMLEYGSGRRFDAAIIDLLSGMPAESTRGTHTIFDGTEHPPNQHADLRAPHAM
jgi:response regulator RpfG family c-di-GMP phosphodiesterase